MIELYFGLKVFFKYILPLGILLVFGILLLVSSILRKIKKKR